MTDIGIKKGSQPELARVLGTRTSLLVGLGVAIGSGILRTPQLVAESLSAPVWILLAWGMGGATVFASSLVMAELATRVPESGGEYAWLRDAYGPFVGFFFGWGYTIFIVGGGAATIAAAFGDAAQDMAGLGSSRTWAAGAVVAVAALNMLGLAIGAVLQNTLTVLKVLVLLGVAGVAAWVGASSSSVALDGSASGFSVPSPSAWVAALPPVIWAYAGSTDSVKLSGEIDNPSKRIPVALFLAIFALAIIYLVINGAFLYCLGPAGLAQTPLPATEVARRAFGSSGELVAAAMSALVFLGALSSTLLATSRVAWALGRDGYGFGFLGKMSAQQAPVGALGFVGIIALVLTLARDFKEILSIYFLAASILFGLVYLSLFVFRARDRGGARPPGAFRCPAAPLIVGFLVVVQVAMALLVVTQAPGDAAATLALLLVVAAAYQLVARSR